MKNWRTTLAGFIGAVPTILGALGIAIPESISKTILALGVLAATYLAKDKNVTGR